MGVTMKVLAVDDNPMTGILLGDTLRELGHESVIVENGADIVSLFEREEPDVCIFDWMMPGVDGLQLVCSIRNHRRGGDAYIIMLSAKQDIESIGVAYELGVDDFIAKPVAPGELGARLHVASRLVDLKRQHRLTCQKLAEVTAELARTRIAA
jgi:DNA-binding response OmpR family regulator